MKNWILMAAAGVLVTGSSPAVSTLSLAYTVHPTAPGSYAYNFTLSLADAAGWSVGDQYDWIIFGDSPFETTSPLNDFHNFQTLDPLTLAYSTGGHNGPTIGFGESVAPPGWAPLAVGDSISWRGVSANYLGEGELLWSTLISSGNGPPANFGSATLQVSAVPEADTWAMMVIGFGALGLSLRRRRRTYNLPQTNSLGLSSVTSGLG